jgi:dephospho-CoA kinase
VRDELLVEAGIVGSLVGHFGEGILAESGLLDRARLGKRVFSDTAALHWLEAFLHPLVRGRWTQRISEAPEADWVVEVPLLFEKQLNKVFDFTVCVACSESVQLARLEKRGIDRTLAGQRISQQLSLVRKIEFSTFVLSNDGTPEFLEREITHLVAMLRRSQ